MHIRIRIDNTKCQTFGSYGPTTSPNSIAVCLVRSHDIVNANSSSDANALVLIVTRIFVLVDWSSKFRCLRFGIRNRIPISYSSSTFCIQHRNNSYSCLTIHCTLSSKSHLLTYAEFPLHPCRTVKCKVH